MASDTTTAAPPLTVTIFTKNDCHYCDATKKLFDRKGVPYDTVNVEEDREPRTEFDGLTPFEYVVDKYGRQMPAVVITDDMGWTESWSGARMDKWLDTVNRFKDAGLLIPEEDRIIN